MKVAANTESYLVALAQRCYTYYRLHSHSGKKRSCAPPLFGHMNSFQRSKRARTLSSASVLLKWIAEVYEEDSLDVEHSRWTRIFFIPVLSRKLNTYQRYTLLSLHSFTALVGLPWEVSVFLLTAVTCTLAGCLSA